MSTQRHIAAPHPWSTHLLGLAIALLAAASGWVVLGHYLERRPLELTARTEFLAIRFEQTLRDNLVPPDRIRLANRRALQDNNAAWNQYHYDVQLPESVSLPGIVRLLRTTMAAANVAVHDAPEHETQTTLSLHLADHEFLVARFRADLPDDREVTLAAPPPGPAGHEPDIAQVDQEDAAAAVPEAPGPASLPSAGDELRQSPPAPQPTARLAIILDDGGYPGEAAEAVLQLDPRLTLAILPNAPDAAATATRAAELGFEIMLHMPMEPHDPAETTEGGLRTEMSVEQIVATFAEALAAVPHVKGVNNHTGSKFCEDPGAIGALLEDVKRRGLYFIDSRTLHTTVAFQIATAMDIPAAERDVFLDHENSRQAILAQWDTLVNLCREKGTAVGIGHFRTLTAQILAEKLPQLEALGIELLHASELVQQR
jgi:uncharacterized protein